MTLDLGRASRLHVLGLPSYLDEKRLWETFAQCGDVTDAKIVKTKAGQSRQFGFVGFKTADQAERAITYFNNSYIDTSRIKVQFAEVANSANLSRPWSKHSKGSSAYAKRETAKDGEKKAKTKVRELVKEKKAKYTKPDPTLDDPELAEFLKVMQPRRAAAIWENDDIAPSAAKQVAPPNKKRKSANIATSDTDEEEDELFQGLPKELTEKPDKLGARKRKKQKGAPVKGPADRADSEAGSDHTGNGAEGEGEPPDPHVLDEGISDLGYLKSRVKASAFVDDAEQSEASSSGEEGEDGFSEGRADNSSQRLEEETGDEKEDAGSDDQRRMTHHAASTSDAEEVPPISETGRLFLRNLPYSATEADLAALFESYGDLSEVHLVVDRTTRKSKGFALIQFMEPAEAEAALAALDGSIFQGRLLHVLPARPPTTSHTENADGKDMPEPKAYKQQREQLQKENAGNRAAWNALFMRQDTVAEAVAAHYGVPKSQLLDRDAADLPVRMALGETHVVAMTKAGLEQEGVNVDALVSAAARGGKASTGLGVDRSETVLLVKNLPYSTTKEELLKTFGNGVVRLVLPNTKTLALVEFAKASAARRAFETLAYRRFQKVPIYLEWAPHGIFKGPPPEKPSEVAVATEKQASEEAIASEVLDATALRGVEEEVESSSIFVKNLAFSTTDKTLLKHFDRTVSAAGGAIRAAKVATRKTADGSFKSSGFGFVECSSEAVAKIALNKLQGTLLDGHKLALQLSTKKSKATEGGKAVAVANKVDKKATKLVVRNVAFEATSKDLRSLFQPFGQVKSLRLPRKFDNSHRGFAFVDFLSHQEAANAMEAVAGTHLYGRRLVCEWAEAEDGLDELRAKTAAKFQEEAQASLSEDKTAATGKESKKKGKKSGLAS